MFCDKAKVIENYSYFLLNKCTNFFSHKLTLKTVDIVVEQTK